MLDDLTAELAEERRKRKEAEQFVESIRQECRAPFVVPALIDAFMLVSDVSEELLTAIRKGEETLT
jgi:hypothetical protein